MEIKKNERNAKKLDLFNKYFKKQRLTTSER